jgi:hypothetical protein
MRARVSAKVESSCQASQSARLAHVPITVRLLCPSSGMSNCPPIHPGLFLGRRETLAHRGIPVGFAARLQPHVRNHGHHVNQLPRLSRRNANTAAAELPPATCTSASHPGFHCRATA